MANLLHSYPSSSRLAAGFSCRYSSVNCEIDLLPSIVCHASRGGQFRFRAEEELSGNGGFSGFQFENRKKKRPWWLDDDDLVNEEEDWSMVFEVLRTLSWMLAPISLSLLLGTDSDAGLMALAVPLLQSVLSLVVDKVLSRPSVLRPIERSRRGTFSRTRKARRAENVGGGVDKGGGYTSHGWLEILIIIAQVLGMEVGMI